MSEGWISLHRKIQDNPIWTKEKFTRGQAWVDLILLANHKRGYIYVRDHKIEVKRGQVGWSQRELSKRWKWSRTKVRKFLGDLEKEQQVKQHKSNSYTIITLINYDKYQQEKPQYIPQESHRKTTGKPQKDTNNNVNNDNNENNKSAREEFSGVPVPESLSVNGFLEKYKKWWAYLESQFNKRPSIYVIEEEFSQLKKLKKDGNDPIAVIAQSIRNKNKSFYELRNFNSDEQSLERPNEGAYIDYE